MELGNITYLKDLDLSRRDYTVKVRVLRLWKQPVNNDSQQCFSIEMIVVDEQGTKMQANVLRRWFPRFEHVLNESECYFIAKPTIGLNESKYKYVNNQNKIGIYCDTNVYPCNDFCGPTYGFSFTSFKDIIDKTAPENEPLDVIGFVADVKDLKKLKTARGKDSKKLNVIIQDLEMHKIYLSLWDTYAERILEHWQNKDEHGVIVVILQFGTLKYFGRFGYVNNSFNVSKLFINSEIDEITSFRNSLLQNSPASSCSTQSSKLSGMFLSMYDEYLVRTEFNNIAEVNLNQVKSVVIVGTVRMIPQDVPWYYFACKACNKKVNKKSDNDDATVGVLIDEDEVYECKTVSCKNTAIQYLQRIKIPLVVQDSTGTLSLTLFDRDVCRLLKTTTSELIEKSGPNKDMFPDEFQALLGKKFAFKIDISQYNLDYSKWVFGVSKLTDDKDIIFELEKKANNIELDTSGSLIKGFTDTQSQETCFTDTQSQQTVNLNVDNLDDLTIGINVAIESNKTLDLKAISEIMDDNVTPLAPISNDKCIEKKDVSEAAKFKRKSKNPDFKKNLVDSLDLEEIGELSTSKPASHGKPILLIPKLEK